MKTESLPLESLPVNDRGFFFSFFLKQLLLLNNILKSKKVDYDVIVETGDRY